MLRLSEAQWAELQAQDGRNFVGAANEQFLADRAQAPTPAERAAVRARMQRAFDEALARGFRSTPHVLRLMYLAADAPGLLEDTAIHQWLTRPGAPPEQRLHDLWALMQHKLKGPA